MSHFLIFPHCFCLFLFTHTHCLLHPSLMCSLSRFIPSFSLSFLIVLLFLCMLEYDWLHLHYCILNAPRQHIAALLSSDLHSYCTSYDAHHITIHIHYTCANQRKQAAQKLIAETTKSVMPAISYPCGSKAR